MIVVVDYGMGNIGSIINMVKKVGGDAVVSSGPRDIEAAAGLILPGVGSFDNGMGRLRAGYASLLTRKVREDRTPILGICLGMQLMGRRSEEGEERGLGWLEADTVRLPSEIASAGFKIPHMGWNSIRLRRHHPLFPDDRERRFYFVHSYHVRCDDPADVLATTWYGSEFTSVVGRDNIVGCQFHPEKSHRYGMEVMANFLGMVSGRPPAAGERPGAPGEPASPGGAARQTTAVRVVPCLLLRHRGFVKTTRFRDPVYLGDPINIVKLFNDMRVDELGILDIAAHEEGKKPDFGLLEDIADNAYMPLSYGGGIADLADIRRVLGIGFEKVIIGSAAFERPELIREAAGIAGRQSVVVSIDARRTGAGYRVCRRSGKEVTPLDPVSHARRAEELGAGEILLTSIDRDGTQAGYDIELIRTVSGAVRIPVIAAGGAGKVDDFGDAVKKGGASAVAAASFFVFHGRRRAVLISFPREEELRAVFAGPGAAPAAGSPPPPPPPPASR